MQVVPGGGVETNDASTVQAAQREVCEEAGVLCAVVRHIALFVVGVTPISTTFPFRTKRNGRKPTCMNFVSVKNYPNGMIERKSVR
jgi:8-oxo-dGTP pyrophosphatase MutT (NUDIX family)